MSRDSVDIVCRYRVKPGHEEEFERLLEGHWKALFEAGLTTSDPAHLQRASDAAGNKAYLEAFAWVDAKAVDIAHESAAVMSMWEPMGALCEDMEFWHVETIT